MSHRCDRPKTVSVSPRPAGIQSEFYVTFRPKTGCHPTPYHHEKVAITAPVIEWSETSGSRRPSGTSRSFTASSSTFSEGIYVNHAISRQKHAAVVPHVQEFKPHFVNFQEFIKHGLCR